jgi:hypothetical protein
MTIRWQKRGWTKSITTLYELSLNVLKMWSTPTQNHCTSGCLAVSPLTAHVGNKTIPFPFFNPYIFYYCLEESGIISSKYFAVSRRNEANYLVSVPIKSSITDLFTTNTVRNRMPQCHAFRFMLGWHRDPEARLRQDKIDNRQKLRWQVSCTHFITWNYRVSCWRDFLCFKS